MKTHYNRLLLRIANYIWHPELSEQEYLIKKTLFYWTFLNWIGILSITPLAYFLGAYPLFGFYMTLHSMFAITFLLFGTRIQFKLSYLIQLYIYLIVTAVFSGYMGGILYSGGIMLMGMYCMFMTAPFRSVKITTSFVLFYVVSMAVLFALDPFLHPHPELSVKNNNIFFILSMICHTSIQVIFLIYFFKNQKQLEENEKRLLKEVDETKTRLYTNITHEFRTPITLILGMADQLRKPGFNLSNAVSSIENNGNKLMRLVNQMMSLSKLDAGEFQTKMIQSNIVSFVNFVTNNFKISALQKNIQLSFTSDLENLEMDFDPDKMEEVISNLLSNAIVFTEEGGKVEIQISIEEKDQEHPHLEIMVKDNGIGIPQDYLPHIFDRFYQVEESHNHHQEGSGIGLALVKENLKLLGGAIHVSSQERMGSVFTATLPITRNAVKKELHFSPSVTNNKRNSKEEIDEITLIDKLPVLLIIEDHQEMISYIRSLLYQKYQVITAADGKSGLQLAFRHIPDIIISDIMMPKMDGFEFLKKLKSNIRTNHIPVIMLTAKADLTSRLEGLELGAEAYITKPFSKEELQIRLRKILGQREILQQRYLSSNMLEQSVDEGFIYEDAFMEATHQLLDQHLDEPDYGVSQLAHDIGMSRSQLYRKFKALTNTSVDKYIRKYRIHQAMHLLKTTDFNISQVALEVGISNPTYFSRIFKEEFGYSPSEVATYNHF